MLKERLALSPDQAREAIGVGRTTMYKMISTGMLRAVHVNRRLLIPIAEIERLLAGERANVRADLQENVGQPALTTDQRR